MRPATLSALETPIQSTISVSNDLQTALPEKKILSKIGYSLILNNVITPSIYTYTQQSKVNIIKVDIIEYLRYLDICIFKRLK